MIPRARKTEITGLRDDAVLVRLAAPPVDGAANDALLTAVGDWLHVPRRAVHIVAGERSRRKRLLVAGATSSDVRARLEE